MPTGAAAAVGWIGSNAAAIGAVTGVASAALGAKNASAARKQAAAQAKQTQQVRPLGEQDKPQEAKEVDLSSIQKRNAQMAAAAGQLGGNQSTLLSGASGIASNTLNLGTSTLLGQ